MTVPFRLTSGFFCELVSEFFIFVGAGHDSTEIPSSWDCVGGAAS